MFFKRNWNWLVIFGFLILIITFLSKSSFLYRTNDWMDVHCYYTVAKGAMNGKVIYKDLYEQKGLYLYFLHMPMLLISAKTYIGSYIFEILFGLVYVTFVYKCLNLFLEDKKRSVFYSIFILACTYSSKTFDFGNSVEEYTLPLMAITFYFALRAIKNKSVMRSHEYFIVGLFAGIIFNMKYTLLGFIAGVMLCSVIRRIMNKDFKGMFILVGWFILGFVVAFIPAIIYTLSTDSLYDYFKVYIYDNIFIYNDRTNMPFPLKQLYAFYSSILAGYLYYPFIIWAIVVVCIKRWRVIDKESFIFSVILFTTTNLFLFIGGVFFKYYGHPIAIFLIPSLVMIDKSMPKVFDAFNVKYVRNISIAFVVLMVMSLLGGRNTNELIRKKNTYPVFHFAEIIEEDNIENATLMNYNFLDMGLYIEADIMPPKYFATLNIPLEEMYETQENGILNGEYTYVVVRVKDNEEEYRGEDAKIHEIEKLFGKYELVSEVDGIYKRMNFIYRLYRLK